MVLERAYDNRRNAPANSGRIERGDACCRVRNVHNGLPGVQDEVQPPNDRELHCIDALVPRIQAWSTSRTNF